jgi:hypothetical protein
LLRWLLSQEVSELHVCLEATNVYWKRWPKRCMELATKSVSSTHAASKALV